MYAKQTLLSYHLVNINIIKTQGYSGEKCEIMSSSTSPINPGKSENMCKVPGCEHKVNGVCDVSTLIVSINVINYNT